MASGIPTRRVTRRADENAPPAISTRSRSTANVPTIKAASQTSSTTGASKIPVLKRTHSAITSTSNSAPAPTGKPATATTTRRAALGEVKNVGKEKERDASGKTGAGAGAGAAAGKSKAGVEAAERRPLASTAGTGVQGGVARRTRPAAPAPAPGHMGVSVKEEKPVLKRKTTAGASSSQPAPSASSKNAGTGTGGSTSRVHVPARSRSTTASTTSAADHRLKERSLNADAGSSASGSATIRAHVKQEIKVEVEAIVPAETEPVRKKRKTSSPVAEDLKDLVDEGVYDADGKEVVLSSGGRGTLLRSPKDSRPKDYGWTDLDAEDEGDPSMVSEYVVDAFKYMVSIEPQTMADPDYMTRQAEIGWPMRTILMEWLIEVHSKFRLLPETLLISVNLVDRFLTLRVVSLAKLQLVGLTAMFIAAKYEEVICPSAAHFIHMTDESFDVEEMLRAERYMLSTLQFDMSYPNPLNYLRRVSKADEYDIQTRTVAKFLIEILLVKYELIAVEPSRLAAAAVWLARLCMERGEWTPNLVHYSGYSEAELLAPAQVMLDYLLDPELNVDSTFYRKYATKKHMKSSVYMRTWAMDKWPNTVDGTNPDAGNELEAMILAEAE